MATVEGKNPGLDRAWRYALLVLGAAIFIGPLLFMVMSSLKPDEPLTRTVVMKASIRMRTGTSADNGGSTLEL